MTTPAILYSLCDPGSSPEHVRDRSLSRGDIPDAVAGSLQCISAYTHQGRTLLAHTYYDEASAHEDGQDIDSILDSLDADAARSPDAGATDPGEEAP